MKRLRTVAVLTAWLSVWITGCVAEAQDERDIVNDSFAESQAQIRDAVMSIKRDIEESNVPALQAAHLDSDKFSKFGPRSFDRQDVDSTNQSEAAFFSSISNAQYDVRDLKIDVFSDVGIATYYPEVTFIRNGEAAKVSGRQTLVFLKVEDEWKLVHEHGTIRR